VVVMEWAPYLHRAAGHRLEECLSVLRDLGYAFHDAESGAALPPDLSQAGQVATGVSINVVGRA
jgi:hypothetical protein